ncbi:PAS domain S-box-containing protein [Spirosoma sp. LMG 31448]|nr:PAS domain S-box-containing protein [Spirosoma utsteinense]
MKREFYQLLQTNEAVFDFIQSVALEGVWYGDLENPTRRWLNAKCYALLGYGPDKRPDWRELIHPDDRGAATHFDLDEFEAGDPAPEMHLRYIHRDQRVLRVTYRPWLVRNQQGEPIRLIGAQTSVTYPTPESLLTPEQQSLYQGILTNQSMYVVKTDLAGKYTFMNPYFSQVFEVKAGELLGTFSLETIYLDDHQACIEAVTQCLQQPGQVCKVQFRKPLPQGGLRHTQWEFIAQLSALSQAIELLCIGYDVTEKVRIDNDFNRLMSTTGEALISLSPDGVLRYVAPSWARLYGYSPGEMAGQAFGVFIHPDDRATWASALTAVVERGTGLSVDQRINHKNGTWVWSAARISIDVLREELFITCSDITDRKQAEAAQQESDQRFQDLADNVREIYWVRALHEPTFLYMNPAYETFSGLSRQSVYQNALAFLDCIVEEDQPVAREGVLSPEPVSSFRFRIRHRAGRLYWMEARVFLLKNEQGLPIRRIGVATDITTAVEKEQLLTQSLANEQTLNRLKSQFISTASHEFRTPLTVISSSAELVKYYANVEASRPTRALIDKHADTIYQQTVFLSELITDTLTLSKIEEGQVTVQREETDLVALSQSVVRLTFGDRADGRQVVIRMVGNAVGVFVDKKLMAHVLTNLLSNAFKFSSANPGLTLCYVPGEVTVAVSDKGIGIPEQDRPFLFGKFFRASNAGHIQGTGLGLSICQEYMRLQGGELELESQEGVGSTFTIRFPLS